LNNPPNKKAKSFVKIFNTEYRRNASEKGLIASSSKYRQQNNTIDIEIKIGLDYKESDKDNYKDAFKGFGCNFIQQFNDVEELLSEDVRFQIHLIAREGEEITNEIVDFKSFSEYRQNLKYNNIQNNIDELVYMLNKNLPKKNDDGAIILKVCYDKALMELQYYYSVSSNDVRIVRDSTGNRKLKRDILIRDKQGNFFRGLIRGDDNGINRLRLVYSDSLGDDVESILLNKSDF